MNTKPTNTTSTAAKTAATGGGGRARRGIALVLGLSTALVVTGVAVTFAAPPAPSAPAATTPLRKTSEVPDAKATPQPVEKLPLKPVQRLISGTLPSSASARGALVKGFPAAVPTVAGSTVVSSSVSANGKTLQATLEATTTSSPADVVAYYEKLFAKVRLVGVESPATPDSRTVAFVRGTDSVTLTVTTTTTGARYTLFGVLRAA